MLKQYGRYLLIAAIALLALLALILNIFSKETSTAIPAMFEPQTFESSVETPYIYVDIKGAILHPGVYKIHSDTRLFQLIRLAGGTTEAADISHLNLALILHDQAIIIVPTNDTSTQTTMVLQEASSQKISISHASKETLITLPNIGPATADKIIDYRQTHGPFKAIEDIMSVSGIGQTTFDAIKPFIVP